MYEIKATKQGKIICEAKVDGYIPAMALMDGLIEEMDDNVATEEVAEDDVIIVVLDERHKVTICPDIALGGLSLKTDDKRKVSYESPFDLGDVVRDYFGAR